MLLALASLVWLRGRDRRLGLAAAAVAVAAFGAGLAPWSLAASDALDGPVLTTTTVPIARAAAFGDAERLCFGPCGPGNIYSLSARYSREVSRADGRERADRAEADGGVRAARTSPPRSYAEDLTGTFHRYAAEPSGFEPAFRDVPGSPPDAVSRVITTVTNLGYAVVMLGALGAVLVVVRRRGSGQVTSRPAQAQPAGDVHPALPPRRHGALLAAVLPGRGPGRRVAGQGRGARPLDGGRRPAPAVAHRSSRS